jgi:Zn-dependent peptidase ImmA (M78 family)
MNIRINNVDWGIILTSNLENLKRSDGSVTLGVTDINLRVIFLWKNLNEHMMRKVLIHELCHAFVFSYGYYMTEDEEEFLCSFIDTYAEDIIEDAEILLSTGLLALRKNY